MLDAPLLIRRARLVPVGTAAPAYPVDLRIRAGRIVAVGQRLAGEDEPVLEAEGRWAIPGLWDQHVHLSVWAQTLDWLALGGTVNAAEVLDRVALRLAAMSAGDPALIGMGHRTGTWTEPPTVAALDAVSGGHPVVLISGDAHHGWLNSAALRLLGLPRRDGVLVENEWFAVLSRLGELAGEVTDRQCRAALADASARGVVGLVDMEFRNAYRDWPARVGRGLDQLRVRTATYPEGLHEVLAAGWRTGDPLPGGAGLVTMGPLKIISDGSLNTRTACCLEPYAGSPGHRGAMNLSDRELVALLASAYDAGLEVAVHAIGDAATSLVLDAVERTGARGSIEHAQLLSWSDVDRLGRLGLRCSVQPGHLLDDREATEQNWPDRTDRCFPLRSLLAAGVPLVFGSDAPVARLDPWLAMAAAVHRGPVDGEQWHPEQAITPAQALAASTDQTTTLAVGARGDVALLDADPLAPAANPAEAAAVLQRMQVAATVVGGRVVHLR